MENASHSKNQLPLASTQPDLVDTDVNESDRHAKHSLSNLTQGDFGRINYS